MAAPRVEERHGPVGAMARRGIDELDTVDRTTGQGRGDVRDLEAEVVEALAAAGEEYRRYQRTTNVFIPWFPKKGNET